MREEGDWAGYLHLDCLVGAKVLIIGQLYGAFVTPARAPTAASSKILERFLLGAEVIASL